MLKAGFLFILLSVVSLSLPGEERDSSFISSEDEVSVWDNGKVEYRHPPYNKIEVWKSNPDYTYDRDQGPGFWDYVLSRLFSWLFSVTEGRPWFFYLLLAIGGLFVLYLLLKFLDVPVSGLFVLSHRQETSGLQFGQDEQEYSPEKLREMLKMYRNNGAYREAVRILFLLYLRELQATGKIVLKHYKTNFDYYREIQNSREREQFRKRMQLFDVIWYGHIDISRSQYDKVEKIFVPAKEGGPLS